MHQSTNGSDQRLRPRSSQRVRGPQVITLDLDPEQAAWSQSDASAIAHVMQTGLGNPVGGASNASSSFIADESELALRDRSPRSSAHV